MKQKKKLLYYCFIIVIFIASIGNVQFKNSEAAEVSDGYLVLVEAEKGQWVAYTDIAVETTSNNVMVKADAIAGTAGLKYSANNKTKQFTLTNNKKYNTYTRNSKSYYYSSGKTKTKKSASYKAYYDDKIGKDLCQAATLASICYYKSFSAKDYKYYNTTGYSKIICYSTVSKIKDLPSFANVKNQAGKALTVKQLKRYSSPDGKWSTSMYYMDGYVNGVRKQWPLDTFLSKFDLFNYGSESESI